MRKELEAERHGSGATSSGADPQRVIELERLLGQYKQQLEEMSRDSRDIESRLAGGKGLVKRSELEDEQERCKALQSGKFTQMADRSTTLRSEQPS